jgi:hypothetical protein
MEMEKQATSRETLLETFRRECDAKFHFLEAAHSARKEFGFSRGGGLMGRLDKYVPGQAPDWFLAVQRYKLRKCAIEIIYGDKEAILHAHVIVGFPRQMFALYEILRAAGIEDEDAQGGIWVLSEEEMQRTVSALAASLERHFALMTSPGREVLARALEIHREQVRQERAGHRQAFLASARNAAANEFRRRNYGKVVELLSPFEDILSDADREKIRLARKYSSEG